MFSSKRIVKHVILSYFLIGFQKEFSYEPSLDKADVLNICLTNPTWTTCWFPFLQCTFKNF